MEIKIDDLSGPEIASFLIEHLKDLAKHSPPESMHALNIEGLRKPEVTFWSAWEQGEIVGCGALKEIDRKHGEVKSMRTSSRHQRKGIAKRILQFIIEEAKHRGYTRISLETGSMDVFEPARKLYTSLGFRYCEPFANYKEDPNSVFMTLEL